MAANNGKICFHSQEVHKLNKPLLNLNLSFVRTPIPHNVCPLQEQLRCSKYLTTSLIASFHEAAVITGA
jgi:hypothetical protein